MRVLCAHYIFVRIVLGNKHILSSLIPAMELYPLIIGGKSTVILSTDSDLFKYLKQVQPDPLPQGDPIGEGEE